MGVEEEAMVGPKAKKSKRGKRNEEGIKEVSHSGNVGVEDDKRIFEKGDVMEKYNVDKGCSEKKMKLKKKKKKKKKGIEDGGIFSRDGEVMEDVDRKKNTKKKEREKRKEGLGVGSDHFVENECDACLVYNEIQDCGGKYENEGEVLGERVVVEKVEKKKKKKKKREKNRDKGYVTAADRDSNKGKTMDTNRKVGEGVDILGEGCDRKVMENVEWKKMKRDKRQTENDLKGVEITGEGRDREIMENVERQKRKGEKGEIEHDSRDVVNTGEVRDEDVTETVEREKQKRDKGQTEDDSKGVEKTDEGLDGEAMEKIERKMWKREKGQTNNNLKGVEITGEGCDGEVMEKFKRKKWKREKGRSMDDLDAGGQDILGNNLAPAEGNPCSTENKIQDSDMKTNSKGKRGKANLAKNGSDHPKAKKEKKKVRFSGHVEVFPLSADSESQKSIEGDDKLVQGKRFSREEDESIKAAVYKYIEQRALGKEGLEMVLNCRSHPEVKGCWKHIAKAIPYRPQMSIYKRAQALFRMGDKRKYTEEDYKLIKRFQEEHGNRWTLIGEELGRYRTHVSSTWSRIKLLNRKRGFWSQDECQTLFDLVNADLRLRLSGEKKTKHGMLRDNIGWSAISDSLTTRCTAACCVKWYRQLTSPMVAEGLWTDTDDYRLINALFSLDASCIENVDWDNLLDHRSGYVCRKRWNQMVLHISQHSSKSFVEQVEIQARRYCPDLVEVREAWDRKPIVA